MANIIFKYEPTTQEKLSFMQEEASFDIADGDDMAAGRFGTVSVPSCIEGIKAPKSPPKVPKMFLSNDCVFDCAYCGCRRSNEVKRRYSNTPAEMAEIAVKTAKSNTHGIFITSAVYKNPDYTEELMLETLKIIRNEYRYKGYLHAKIMPGTDERLIRQVGLLADRISVNIELPNSEGYKTIAKQKNKTNILTPMNTIKALINEYKHEKSRFITPFAKSGQTTQMMVGTMRESDKTIIRLAEALYKKYEMRRVYYSAFSPIQICDCLPDTETPNWRSRRLYQADRLIQLYGMTSDEILPEEEQNLDFDIDPKASWALRNINLFPVEVNTADYDTLVRVPGIGITSAKKIIAARRECRITFDLLKAMRVPLKNSIFFITANGKYNGGGALDSPYLRRRLWSDSTVASNGMEQISFLDYNI